MIEMSYSQAIIAYILIWIISISFLWLRELRRVKRYYWQMSNRRVFHCVHCHHSFITKNVSNVSRCPRCNGVCFGRKRGIYER